METTLEIGQTYQLIPIDREDREDGVIYLNSNRTFRLLSLDDEAAWIKCTETGKRFVMDAWRLRNY